VTARDLGAVCERHRISVVELCGGFYAAQGETIGEWTASSPADAVVALLKARYGIGTGKGLVKAWKAWTDDDDTAYADTELAAVVALADALRGDE
jgi:hypothetical protein